MNCSFASFVRLRAGCVRERGRSSCITRLDTLLEYNETRHGDELQGWLDAVILRCCEIEKLSQSIGVVAK